MQVEMLEMWGLHKLWTPYGYFFGLVGLQPI
jgi:hypothetical protein